jgi:hypothetical protein
MVKLKEVHDAFFSPTRMHYTSNEIITVGEILVTPLMLVGHIGKDHTCNHDTPEVFYPKTKPDLTQ